MSENLDSSVIDLRLKAVDAQAMAKEHPATFEAPSTEDLACIRIGDYVKTGVGFASLTALPVW